MLLISDSCHSCFACHLQTVHPIPVIFIPISTEIISSFQWHTWFAKIMPGSSFSFRSMHMHCISHLAYHAMFMCWLFTMLFACFRVVSLLSFGVVQELRGFVRLHPFVSFMDSFFFL